MQQDNPIPGYLAGLQKLIQLWNANAHLPAQRLFAETWNIIFKNEATFAAPFKRNRFDIPWSNFVFVDVSRNMKALRPDFFPELKLHFSQADHGSLKSAIFATLHSDIEYGIVSALQKYGSDCTIITASRNDPLPTLYDHTSGMNRILRDQNCLLVARKQLLEGRNLIVPVDYTVYDAEAKAFIRKAGMGVFDFAKKCRFKLFYILPVIGSEGEVDLFVEAADLKKDAAGCADDFLAFCVSKWPGKAGLTRDNWFSDTKGKMNAIS